MQERFTLKDLHAYQDLQIFRVKTEKQKNLIKLKFLFLYINL